MAIGKFLKGIGKDLKKGLKGSKEYQEGKAKRKAKRAKSPLGKAIKQVAKDVKTAAKGSKEYQAGKAKRKAVKAKKKEGKTWSKAVKKQKKAGGESLSSLVGKRSNLKPGTAEYAKVQNAINKAYGVKKRHKATTGSRKPAAPKPKAKPKSLPKGTGSKVVDKALDKKIADREKYLAELQAESKAKKKVAAPKKKVAAPADTTMEGGEFGKYKYEGGGKVESNPYGWPTTNARGKK